MTRSRLQQWMARTRRALAKCLAGEPSSHPATTTRIIPASEIYLSPSRDVVARQAPYPLLPSMALSPGHAACGRLVNGTPVLVYRQDITTSNHSDAGDADPPVTGFVNRCRHRGAPLLRESSSPCEFTTSKLVSPRLTCPYHAWTYDVSNGKLVKVPGEIQAFGDLDKTLTGLQPISCFEKAGMVWVGGDKMIAHGLWKVDEMHEAVLPFVTHNHDNTGRDPTKDMVGYREWNGVPANWQLLVETALESYHVKTLHRHTLHQVTNPTWAMASEWMDDDTNFSMTVPLRNFVPQPEDDASVVDFLGQTSTTHFIFPMTMLTIFKRFTMVSTVETADQTGNGVGSPQSKIRAWGLSHPFYDPKSEVDGYQRRERDFEAVITAVQEDWDMSVAIQHGLTHSADAVEFMYGGYESNNVQFSRNVERVQHQLSDLLNEGL